MKPRSQKKRREPRSIQYAIRESARPLPRGDACLFFRNIPRTVRDAFHGKCAEQGRTMTGLILAVLEDVTRADVDDDDPRVIDLAALSLRYPDPR